MNHSHLPVSFHYPIVPFTWQNVSGLPSFPLTPRGEGMNRECKENKELLQVPNHLVQRREGGRRGEAGEVTSREWY